jgi:pyrroloquinoline quinone biosynthesis protein E
MYLSQFKGIIDQFPRLQRLKLQGMGEPLLNPDLFAMIRYAKSRGIDVSTYTNGSLLERDGNARKLVNSGIDLVRVSLDSAIPADFQKIRPGSDFQTVVRNLRSFNALALAAGHPAVEVWTVVTTANVHQLPAILDLASDLGIGTVHFQIIMNTFDYKAAVQDRLQPYQVDRAARHSQIEAAVQYAAGRDVRLVIQKSKARSRAQPCHWPFDSAFISVEGFVVPCCTIADPGVIQMGNVFEEPFARIWANERYQAFRKSILTHQLLLPCRNCYTALED